MGNKPTSNNRIHQPYNQMVEDAISALKDRPGSTQDDVFDYLETKYEGRIPPRAKKNLETVIRSVIKAKQGVRRGGGRPGTKRTGRKVRFRAKLMGPRRGPGRPPGRPPEVRKLAPRVGKESKKAHKTLMSGKKLQMPGPKSGGHHRLLKRVRRNPKRQ